MPIYTYTCTACNDVIEKRQSFSDPPLTTCEQCGGALRKVIHPVGIVFKGSGWYITDSRSSSSTASSSNGSSTSSSDGSGSKRESATSTSSESKPTTSSTSSSESKPTTPSKSSSESKSTD
ncbi:MAG: FmdB family transcriptional regulator [Chloroflexi bacterium]|nr:FmdB family transcriptional regulator [Chloroflexota bacterium]